MKGRNTNTDLDLHQRKIKGKGKMNIILLIQIFIKIGKLINRRIWHHPHFLSFRLKIKVIKMLKFNNKSIQIPY